MLLSSITTSLRRPGSRRASAAPCRHAPDLRRSVPKHRRGAARMLIAGAGGIKAVTDRTEALRREVAHQPFRQRIADDGDAIARLHAERASGHGQFARPPGPVLATWFRGRGRGASHEAQPCRHARAQHGPAATGWSVGLRPDQAAGQPDARTVPRRDCAASWSEHPLLDVDHRCTRRRDEPAQTFPEKVPLSGHLGDCFLSIIR